MFNRRRPSIALALTVALSVPALAQKPARVAAASAPTDTARDARDEESSGQSFLFGVAGGALSYDAGRSEQALGAVLRWVPVRWLSLSATPTSVRASESATTTLTNRTRSGLTDLPLEASASHGFHGVPWSPSLALSLGVTLPVGDTASGLGSGEVGYSTSGGVGFAPIDGLWVHVGAGRSLTRFSVQSAFSSGTGWGDISAGTSISEHVEASASFSGDVGGVDSTLGRSTSLGGGLTFGLGRLGTLNVSGSHGMTGVAPKWSISVGIGTAFPYLNHLGGSSPAATLQQSFGGGTHGIGNGKGAGVSGGSSSSSGHGRKP